MSQRVSIGLDEKEFQQLRQLARQERRLPTDQARVIVEEYLHRVERERPTITQGESVNQQA